MKLRHKLQTLVRDPKLALLSTFKRGDRRRAVAYLARENVDTVLRAGRADEFRPKLIDLWHLHSTIRRRKPKVVLELGIGFSIIAMAHALMRNAAEGSPGHLWSVDTSTEWIENTRAKLDPELLPLVTLCESRVLATEIDGELCHVYEHLPDINPDLLLVDGPSPRHAVGEVRGLSFGHGTRRPAIAADPLLLEAGLPADFLMIIDGRYANMHFLKRRLKRRYRFRWNRVHRYSTFELVE